MKSDHLLARTLKEMMAKEPLENISPLTLSKKCGISVKTFYYHYHDIYDLLTQVFLDEKIVGISDTKNINELIVIIWQYYLQNQGFLIAAVESAGKDLVSEFFYNIFYVSFLRFIENFKNVENLSIDSKKVIARFYASGYSNLIINFLSNYKNKSYENFIKIISTINEEVLKNNINV